MIKVLTFCYNPNSIHAFNRIEEEGHAGRRYNGLILIDLTQEELCTMGVTVTLNGDEE